ncbi:MAG: RING finger domain-containing protein [Candidatus Babeliales bacterium]
MKKFILYLFLSLSTFNLFPMITQNECAICLNTMENPEITLACHETHSFHFDCIQKWKKVKPICPLCKKNILSESGSWLINKKLSTKNFIENENEDILNNMFSFGFMLFTCQGLLEAFE